jgi:hypothetical protein
MSPLEKRGGDDGKKEVIHAKNQRSTQVKTFGTFHSGYCQGLFDWEGNRPGVFMSGLRGRS